MPERYDPSLLFPVERAEARAADRPRRRAVPFTGSDAWTAWELAWLDPAGRPQVAVGRFDVPATSPRIVESKSVKLYLASLNHERYRVARSVRRHDRARPVGGDRRGGARVARVAAGASRRSRASGATVRRSTLRRSRPFPTRPIASRLATTRVGRRRDAQHVAVPLGVPGHRAARLRDGDRALPRPAHRTRLAARVPRRLTAATPAFTSTASSASSSTCARACRPQTLAVEARFTRRGGSTSIRSAPANRRGGRARRRTFANRRHCGSGFSLRFRDSKGVRLKPARKLGPARGGPVECRPCPSRSPCRRAASSTRRCRSSRRRASCRPRIRRPRASSSSPTSRAGVSLMIVRASDVPTYVQ